MSVGAGGEENPGTLHKPRVWRRCGRGSAAAGRSGRRRRGLAASGVLSVPGGRRCSQGCQGRAGRAGRAGQGGAGLAGAACRRPWLRSAALRGAPESGTETGLCTAQKPTSLLGSTHKRSRAVQCEGFLICSFICVFV